MSSQSVRNQQLCVKCRNYLIVLIYRNVDDILDASNAEAVNIFQAGKKLLAIQPWGPVTDEEFLPQSPLDAFINVCSFLSNV